MPRLSSLGLFGVIHVDRRRKVTRELDAFAGDVDALFIEYPRDFDDPWLFGRLLVRVPTYLVGAMLLQVLFFAPLAVLSVRDLYPTEVVATRSVASTRELPIHPVDDHPHLKMQRAGLPAIASTWVVLAGVVWLEPVAAVLTAVIALGGGLVPILVRRRGHRYPAIGLAVLGLAGAVGIFLAGQLSLLLLLSGVVAFGVALVVTIEARNEVMLDRVEGLAANHGYEAAVLVTGKGHLGGLARQARDRDLHVRAIHVSKWLRSGVTYTDPTGSPLPEIGLGRDGSGDIAVAEASSGEPGADSHLGRRMAAALLDLGVGSVFAVLGMTAVGYVDAAVAPLGDVVLALAILLAAVLCWVGYHAAFEAVAGQTVGKKLLGLRVVHASGASLAARGALVRNALRPIDAVFFYGVGFVVVLVTARHQRIGDLAAKTVVVRSV